MRIYCYILVIYILKSLFLSSSIVYADEYDTYYYGASNHCNNVYDPYEKLNRKIFAFNLTLDKLLLKPIAQVYDKTTNNYVKSRVSSFNSNLAMPFSTLSYVLQGNIPDASKALWRFLLNSTLGILGIFDVASKFELTVPKQGFADVLASYGATPGAYIILPFIGSTTGRKLLDDIVFDNITGVSTNISTSTNLTIKTINLVNNRAKLLYLSEQLEQDSIDYYTTIKVMYFQNNEHRVNYPQWFDCSHYNQLIKQRGE